MWMAGTLLSQFYTTILGRPADSSGLASFVDYIVNTGDLEGAAVAFLASPEFEGRALTARGYVAILYRTFLRREPDAPGLDGWENVLRTTLLRIINTSFVPSAEFQQLRPQVCGGVTVGSAEGL